MTNDILAKGICSLLGTTVFALLSVVGPAHAQPSEEDSSPWLPGEVLFEPLLADPLEAGFRGSLLAAGGRGFYDGTHVEAEVVLGECVPLVRLRRETPGGPGVTVGFETGILTRFYVDMPSDLINADFRVGFPVAARYASWEARLELRHVSAHLGDDFAERFDAPFENLSYEGVMLFLARRVGAVRLYGGGGYNYRRQNAEQLDGRAGVEYDGLRRDADTRVWPFAAAHVRLTDDVPRAAVTATTGVGTHIGIRRVRLEARAHTGPTPLGQFRGLDEQFLGLGLRID